MAERYLIRIAVWPYSSIEQKYAGPREQVFTVAAQSMRQALEKAELFQAGILTSPWVWEAPIKEVREAAHEEDARPIRGEPLRLPITIT